MDEASPCKILIRFDDNIEGQGGTNKIEFLCQVTNLGYTACFGWWCFSFILWNDKFELEFLYLPQISHLRTIYCKMRGVDVSIIRIDNMSKWTRVTASYINCGLHSIEVYLVPRHCFIQI